MWKPVQRYIRNHEKFVVTSHIHPDGDAIGSEVALAAFLRDLGKTVTIVNSSPTAQNNRFLDPEGAIRVYPERCGSDVLDGVEAVFIVDVNNWAHLGRFGEALAKSDIPRICIDHHEGVDEDFADVVVSDTTAAAVGILIYELIVSMNGAITPQIAEAVFAAIVTDTGTFRFSNTDTRTFLIAADLCREGINPFTIHRSVFAKTRAAVTLLGRVLATMQTTADGHIAWIHATQKMFQASGAAYDDSDGLLDVVRAIDEVEYCLFFKELASGQVKVSLRSNGRADVFAIARALGGGGHRMAAGVTVDGPLDQAVKSVIEVCTRRFRV